MSKWKLFFANIGLCLFWFAMVMFDIERKAYGTLAFDGSMLALGMVLTGVLAASIGRELSDLQRQVDRLPK